MKILLLGAKNKNTSPINKINFENIIFCAFCLAYIVVSLLGSFLFYSKAENVTTLNSFTICLDAGHGGIDGGAVGENVKESDVNLQITLKLGKLFEAQGFNVIYTRKEDICLADEKSPSFKLDDMKKRREIIQSSCADMVISIHCKKFKIKSCVVAQVFYKNVSECGKNFCDIMTKQLVKDLPGARTFGLGGDYYILDSTDKPAIIVECGFISNPEEEKLLMSDEYQSNVANSIYMGTLRYLLSENESLFIRK